MESFTLAVIPAQAGIQWLQVFRDPRFRWSHEEECSSSSKET